jgi:hypothetical protein
VKEEAKQAGCPYLLLTTIKHVQKRCGGDLNDYAVTVRNKDELTLGY